MKRSDIEAVVLAGGQARRMGGVDKGLQNYEKQPLFMHVVHRLVSQVANIKINANRNLDIYKKSGLIVFSDEKSGYLGTLSGILTGLRRSQFEAVLFVPCDSPCIPLDLVTRLCHALSSSLQNATIAYAYDGQRAHPTFILIKRTLKDKLANYLDHGERRLLKFVQENNGIEVDFSDQPQAFLNINTLQELENLSILK